MLVSNKGYTTKLFDGETLSFVEPTSNKIKLSLLDSSALANHKKNCLRMSQRPDTYIPVIGHLVPIPPRTTWSFEDNKFRQVNKIGFRTDIPKGLKDLKKTAKRLIGISKRQLAVELSGGFDTSLVIGVLRSLGEDPALIGAISDRYEFRTERFIQEKIAQSSSTVCFVPEDDALPFEKLKQTPVHAIPNKASLFYYLNEVTAKWASESQLPFVLNGIGFDSILIDQIPPPSRHYVFDQINLDDGWANDYVFSPKGVRYVNVASINSVQKCLIAMRAGEGEDSQKSWARETLSEFVPPELSKYRYKASFAATYDHGLEKNREEILEICDEAHRLTEIDELKATVIDKLIDGFRLYDHKAEFEFLARLSFANWIHQLAGSGSIDHRG